MKTKKANLFIVGAAKSGTTFLQQIMASHSDIFMSPVKEPNFFSNDIDKNKFRDDWKKRFNEDSLQLDNLGKIIPRHSWYVRNEKEYNSLYFDSDDESYRGEASVSYLYSKKAANAIRNYAPDAKIIMILRNPIDRAISHVLMDIKTGLVNANTDPMSAIIDDYSNHCRAWGKSHLYIDLGLYFEQVKRYFDNFPKEQIKIIFFDTLISDPKKVCQSISRFLDLTYELNPNINSEKNEAGLPKNYLFSLILKNKSFMRPFSKLIPADFKAYLKSLLLSNKNMPIIQKDKKEQLIDYFESDIINLQRLLDCDLSEWLKIGEIDDKTTK